MPCVAQDSVPWHAVLLQKSCTWIRDKAADHDAKRLVRVLPPAGPPLPNAAEDVHGLGEILRVAKLAPANEKVRVALEPYRNQSKC